MAFDIADIMRWHTREGRVFDHSNDTVVVTRTLLNSGADEIERLRAVVANAETKLKLLYMAAGLGQTTGKAALAELSAVIETLSAALLDQQSAPEKSNG